MTFRDRFFTPQTAKAIMSPLGIVLAGVGGAVGLLAAGPVGAVVLGAAFWGGRVLAGMPKGAKVETIDAFTLSDPWRTYVGRSQAAQMRFDRTVDSVPDGPLRERLLEIGRRVHDGLTESWRIGQRGHEIDNALRELQPNEVYEELIEAQRQKQTPDQAKIVQALESQYNTILRLDETSKTTQSKLRVLQERLDELVARAVEIKASRSTDVGGLDTEIDAVVDEMEALRQAIEEANSPGRAATSLPDLGRTDPGPGRTMPST
jgi:outer membrane murein-binding lipoprotein Lpp